MGVDMIDLSLLNRIKTNAIVIRHADRDSMQQWQIEQPLNEIGRQNAISLGHILQGFNTYVFFSSPVYRCQQTIEYIQKGIFQEQKTEENNLSELLGKPGPFVVDHQNNEFKINPSCKKVVMAQIAHKELVGIRPTAEGAKMLIDFIVEHVNRAERGTLLVFVTHDAIIAPVIFELTGEKFDYENWPDFLDGFIVEKNADDFKVIRKNKEFELRKFQSR